MTPTWVNFAIDWKHDRKAGKTIVSGLVIDHGDPWWLSPNVWAVLTGNPDELSPGELGPRTGNSYYLKARVRNTETFRVDNSQVNLYWANPAPTITRGSAHLVGNAFVSVDGGQTAEVLCLSPWVPTFAGHECILAEVAQGIPSLSDPLDGQHDPHVAQRNLSVITSFGTAFQFAFEVHNPERNEQVFAVEAQQASHKQLEAVARQFGQHLGPLAKGTIRDLGFIESPCPDMSAIGTGIPKVRELKLGPYGCSGYSVVGKLDSGAALLHVSQTVESRRIGGLSVLVLHQEKE